MKLNEINDPKVRRKAVEWGKRIEEATQEQADDIIRDLDHIDGDESGKCFGKFEDGRIDCRRCWMEEPCCRFRERFVKD